MRSEEPTMSVVVLAGSSEERKTSAVQMSVEPKKSEEVLVCSNEGRKRSEMEMGRGYWE
jgi:hypothetical protein